MNGTLSGFAGVVLALGWAAAAEAVDVERYKTIELVFTASAAPANPFDTVLLKVEVTDPAGAVFTVEGFFDGDGDGGQSGKVWKARLCPYRTGTWSWRTVAGDAPDTAIAGLSGTFNCVSGSDLGGVVAQGRHFKLQNGGNVFLVGNFLDFAGGLRTTHTYMSETTTDTQRNAIIARQRDFHTSNKANVYFANKGDYSSQSVTPWVGSASSNDKTKMDLARWKLYDGYLRRFKDERMLAEMWFFADDSAFGGLAEADQKRLIRYGMARSSAFTHVMYIIALEWAESFTLSRVNSLGTFLQQKNPWKRVVSVHNHTDWQFGGQSWPNFIATQAGNSAGPDTVNSVARTMFSSYSLPHIDEEFGIMNADVDARLRSNLWANLGGGAAGGGTGSDLKALQRFLNQSRLPFQRMSPQNGLVTGGGSTRFCLAETGRHYLVYSQSGSFTLTVSGSGLSGRWFDPRNPSANLGGAFSVSAGSPTFTPPSSTTSDWVLHVGDGSNLNSGVTHPTGVATVVQVVVPQSGNPPPSVALTAPTGGSSFAVGTLVAVAATASDSNGTVTKVEFFDGATKIGEDTNSPYSISWNTTGASAGTHTLTARATDNAGAQTDSAAVSITLTSTSNQPPGIATFTVAPDTVVKGTAVTYTLKATDPEGASMSYLIDVDNNGAAEKSGTLASGATVTYAHTFTTAGTRTGKATVTDSASQSKSATVTLTVVEPLGGAQVLPSPSSGPAPLTVQFGASQSGGIPPYSYSWVFGDGATDPGPGNDVSHTYTAAGTYTAKVTVKDSTGATSTGQAVITVTAGTGGIVGGTSPAAYVWDTLDVGKPQYVDRTYAFGTVPAAYVGLPYLKTANDDKLSTGSSWVTFTLSQAATVYVAHDDRITPKPSWMTGWADTGHDLVSGGPFSLYAKDFAAGTVTLGGNGGTSDSSMYNVVVRAGSGGGGGVFTVTVDSVSTGKAYTANATAKAGALHYIDRSYTVTSLGGALAGGVLIRTANDDKSVTANPHLRFSVNVSATVWVCYDKRGTQVPAWLNDGTWTVTVEDFSVSDGGASPMRVYRKSVPAGQVSLGGNLSSPATGAGSHYVVIVKAANQ